MKRLAILILSLSLFLCATACDTRQQMPYSEQIGSVTSELMVSSHGEASAPSLDANSGTEGGESSPDSAAETTTTIEATSAVTESASSVFTDSILTSMPAPSESNSSSMVSTSSLAVQRSRSAQALIDWVQNGGDNRSTNQAFLTAVEEKGQLFIPYSTREELKDDGLQVIENTTGFVFDFRTYTSDILGENEYYSICVSPLAEENFNTELIDLYYPTRTDKKTGVYNGMTYAYCDGYKDAEHDDSFDACAWFIKDGYLIKIWVIYANCNEPWSNEYFDYFDFETVTL